MNEYLAWQHKLAAKYPHLFQRVGVEPRGVIVIGDGWRGIVETMLARIADTLVMTVGSHVTIDYIEEKYGTMRVSTSGLVVDETIRSQIEEATDLAEARSACSCSFCGAEGRLFETSHGWLFTACEAHREGAAEVESSERSDLVVKRVFDEKRLKTLICRTYDRSTDRFVDIDPRSVDLEE